MRAKRTDANHADLCAAFRSMGFSVLSTHTLGGGAGDAIIARDNLTAMVEYKTPTGKENALQIEFRSKWKGRIYLARTIEDVDNISRGWLIGEQMRRVG